MLGNFPKVVSCRSSRPGTCTLALDIPKNPQRCETRRVLLTLQGGFSTRWVGATGKDSLPRADTVLYARRGEGGSPLPPVSVEGL